MLQGGNPLTVGVGIVIEVIRKNNSDYDLENVGGPDTVPTAYDPIYLGSLLRLFANHIPDFMALTRNSTHTVIEGGRVNRVELGQLNSAWGAKIEPLGFDRFKTCELMAELLHCSNMGLLNEPGSDDYVRQRDAERERLIAALGPPTGDTSGIDFHDTTADLGNGSAVSSGFPEDSKALEVTNASEEDGFEEVSSSGVLVEGTKDIEEQEGRVEEAKAEEAPVSASKTRETKTGDDLVEEPLAEPEHGSDSKEETTERSTSPEVEPQLSDALSPTTSLVDKFGKIKLDDEHAPSESTSEPQEPPALPPREQDDSSPISPHPGDTPTPLVTKPQAESSASDASTAAPNASSTPEPVPGDEPVTDSNPQSRTDELTRQCIQLDTNGEPVIGDYLKIMFVEHRVVPTILVSELVRTDTLMHYTDCFAIGVLFPFPVE